MVQRLSTVFLLLVLGTALATDWVAFDYLSLVGICLGALPWIEI